MAAMSGRFGEWYPPVPTLDPDNPNMIETVSVQYQGISCVWNLGGFRDEGAFYTEHKKTQARSF
jgi:hypothetical protein